MNNYEPHRNSKKPAVVPGAIIRREEDKKKPGIENRVSVDMTVEQLRYDAYIQWQEKQNPGRPTEGYGRAEMPWKPERT